MGDPEKGAVPLSVLDHKYGLSAHASEGGWRKVTADMFDPLRLGSSWKAVFQSERKDATDHLRVTRDIDDICSNLRVMPSFSNRRGLSTDSLCMH